MLIKILCVLIVINLIYVHCEHLSLNIIRRKSSFEQILNHHDKFLDKLNFKLDDFNSKGKRDNDSIALYRFLDDEFFGQIVIGHPGQILYVNFDTSWLQSWVMSSKCSPIKYFGCMFHNRYDHRKSSEYKKDGRPFVVNFDNFNMTGFYSYDNISIAHSTATQQSFVEIVTVPKTYIMNRADGVLGLGMKIDSYDPFFYTLLKQKKIKNPLFSIYLNRDTQSNRGGNILLGLVDDKHIHKNVIKNRTIPEKITYLPVDNNIFYWQFNMDRVYLNDQKEPKILCSNGCKATVDTSSTVIRGPKEDIDVIHDLIDATELILNRYGVNCDTINKLPGINFQLGGKNFTLTGPEYTIRMAYKSAILCLSAFQPYDTNRWYLGGSFLAEYYSIYNLQEKTVGFVKAAK